jgi:hypothetical protein
VRSAVLLSVVAHAAVIIGSVGSAPWHLRHAERSPAGVTSGEPVSPPSFDLLWLRPRTPTLSAPSTFDVEIWTEPDRGGEAAAMPAASSGLRTARGGTRGSEPGPAGDEAPRGSNLLGMRGKRTKLALVWSGEALDRFLAATKPLPPPVEVTGKLRPTGGGEHRVKDAAVTMRVHRDGTVDLAHRPDFKIRFRLPIPSLEQVRSWGKSMGDGIEAWSKDPYAGTRVGSTQDLPRHAQAAPGYCDDFGALGCSPPAESSTPVVDDDHVFIPFISGHADLSSYLARKTGVGDEYAARKLELLDTTRAERAAIGATYRARQLDRSAELMQRNLERVWTATTDPAARREALFELWDECAEGESSTGTAGARARAMVIGFIRARLPAGTADAFTADEIARLDARRSSAETFAPY